MQVKIDPSWGAQLQSEFDKPYFAELVTFVRNAYQTSTTYPPAAQIFNAFKLCPFAKVKVVIIGQDPYHGPGQANGLSFSVNKGIRIPPSLQNIFKEIKNDLGREIPQDGDLSRWANQGVLLLNATLTVQARQAGSHQNKGWEEFTDNVIQLLSHQKTHLIFLLWGAYAQKKRSLIDTDKHLILESAHPSPFSADRGFFGNKHFSQTNNYLVKQGLKPIDW